MWQGVLAVVVEAERVSLAVVEQQGQSVSGGAGGWRLGCPGGGGGAARAVRDPSLSVSRWRVNTPSLTNSITNKGDWRCVVVVVVCGELVYTATHAYK